MAEIRKENTVKGEKAFTHASSWDSCNNPERTGHI